MGFPLAWTGSGHCWPAAAAVDSITVAKYGPNCTPPPKKSCIPPRCDRIWRKCLDRGNRVQRGQRTGPNSVGPRSYEGRDVHTRKPTWGQERKWPPVSQGGGGPGDTEPQTRRPWTSASGCEDGNVCRPSRCLCRLLTEAPGPPTVCTLSRPAMLVSAPASESGRLGWQEPLPAAKSARQTTRHNQPQGQSG